ncbi:MAG: PadR family transcriptional regulator [Candidatus Sedimenticola sp. 20ELBAFRAG]
MDTSSLCLGVLCLGEASGYEIKKMFEESFSHFQAASFGSIYPALSSLTEKGLVTFREELQEKRPTKKVFSITQEGRTQFLETLAGTEPTEQYRSDFLVLMMFAHLQPPQQLEKTIDNQAANIRGELETLQGILKNCTELTAGMRFTIEYGIAANQALLKLIESRKSALMAAIDQEQSALKELKS